MKQLDHNRFAFLEPEMDLGTFVILFAYSVNNRNPALPVFLNVLKQLPNA